MYSLTLTADGDLQLCDQFSNIVWSPTDSNQNADFAAITSDGSFMLVSDAGVRAPIWSTGPTGSTVDRLVLDDLGRIRLYSNEGPTQDRRLVWQSPATGVGLDLGESLRYRTVLAKHGLGEYVLAFTAAGDLRLCDGSGHLVWSPVAPGTHADRLTLCQNGDLALYSDQPVPDTILWSSGTPGLGIDGMEVTWDGHVALFANNQYAWRSPDPNPSSS